MEGIPAPLELLIRNVATNSSLPKNEHIVTLKKKEKASS